MQKAKKDHIFLTFFQEAAVQAVILIRTQQALMSSEVPLCTVREGEIMMGIREVLDTPTGASFLIVPMGWNQIIIR